MAERPEERSGRRGRAPISVVCPDAYLLLTLTVLAVLLAVNLASVYAYFLSDSGRVRWVAPLFLFDAESNFATLFNFSLIAVNAALLGFIALASFGVEDRWRWHWLILGLLFLVLAYDEAASLHERLVPLGRAIVPSDGILFFSWVIFGAGFVLVVALGYLRFLLALPARTAALVALAGSLYVGGAIGVELWGGRYASENGMNNVLFHLICAVEETLEMTGQILFGYALLHYLVEERDAGTN